MLKPLDWDRLTHGSTDTYRDIDSLERIRQPSFEERRNKNCRFPEGFPARGSPNWWALRRRYEELLGREQRRLRQGSRWSAAEYELSDIARMVPLEQEASADFGEVNIGPAQGAYERINPGTGLHAHLSPALTALCESNPARFAVISAEAKRLQTLGRPTRASVMAAARPMPK